MRSWNRLGALKRFELGRMRSPRERTRFRSAAEALARLPHPNIVQIFDVGPKRSLPFLALKLAKEGNARAPLWLLLAKHQ